MKSILIPLEVIQILKRDEALRRHEIILGAKAMD